MALLEAMQERQVTIGDTTYPLPDPFLVLATQNPIEQEGTYPLPEAQLDRFMLMIKVGYPTREEERAIMDRMTAPMRPSAEPGRDARADRRGARASCSEVYIDEHDPRLHRRRRARDARAERARPRPSWPLHRVRRSARARRSASNLAARAHAFLRHRGYVTPEDVKAIGADVLRHRVILTYEAEAEEVTAEDVVRRCSSTSKSRRARRATDAAPRAAQEAPQDRDRHRSGWSTSSSPGSTTRCSRAAASRSREVRQYQPGDDVRAHRLERHGAHERRATSSCSSRSASSP